MNSPFDSIVKYLNDNSGLLQVITFVISLLIAWASGLFNRISDKPNFKIKMNDIPSYLCIIRVKEDYNGHPAFYTAISTYLNITNVGKRDSTITSVQFQYRSETLYFQNSRLLSFITSKEKSIHQFKSLYKYSDLLDRKFIRSYFDLPLEGNSFRRIPLLLQKDKDGFSEDSYIKIGNSINGMLYFESYTYWGGYRPYVKNEKVDIRIIVTDAFGISHKLNDTIQVVDLKTAQKVYPEFGLG